MEIAIIGSRSFNNYDMACQVLDKMDISLVVSGGAQGADSLGERYANEHNIPTLIFKPDWQRYGRGAGIVRNRDIIAHCDHVVAFWDGESKGTENSLQQAKENKKPVTIFWI